MRRDRLKILLDILEICREGANKTKIVYQANLNFKMINLYLDILDKEGLLTLKCSAQSRLYFTTEKGMALLIDVGGIYERLEQYSQGEE